MSFNSKEGMEIYSDVSLSYAIEPRRVPDFYVKYRVSDLDTFTHGILRDIVRNSLNEVASDVQRGADLRRAEGGVPGQGAGADPAEDGSGGCGDSAVRIYRRAAGAGGDCARRLRARRRRSRTAEQAHNELAKTQAEAAKTVAEAEGEAKAAVTRAQGEAEANKIRQASLTPQLLELRKIENSKALIDRWNGQLPTVQGGGQMLMELPKMQ